MDTISERVAFLQELINSVSNISMTVFDKDYRLISSNSPYYDLFQLFFTLDDPPQPTSTDPKEVWDGKPIPPLSLPTVWACPGSLLPPLWKAM